MRCAANGDIMCYPQFDPYQGMGIGGQLGTHRRAGQAVGSSSVAQSSSGYAGWAVGPLYTYTSVEGADPTCDYAGKGTSIRAGEIVAYRLWMVREGNRLFSVFYSHFEWFPEKEAEGSVDLVVGPYQEMGGGIHAFKAYPSAQEYAGYPLGIYCLFGKRELEDFYGKILGFVLGEVELWGRVHEHTLGYRAQYAKPSKFITATHEGVDLDKLRARFGV